VADLSKRNKSEAPEPPLTPVEPLLYEPHWTGDVLKLLMHAIRRLNELNKKINEISNKIDNLTVKIEEISKMLEKSS